MSAPATEHDRLADLAVWAGQEFDRAPALEVLSWAAAEFGNSWCVASSMADAVVPHLASTVRPGVDVIFLDTGYHFVDTIGTRDAVAATLPVTVKTVRPDLSVADQDARHGADLYARDPDACCAMRKVAPLGQALAPYSAWVSGLRREESLTRASARVVDWDAQRGLVKVNPIANWTQDDVETYITEHAIMVNPLLSDGYRSIGCEPCTQRVVEGADARSGRWAGLTKVECGLHL
ncbi:MAG: phosphoadenylyl-sulfate reductase [Actinomycetota bacterium]|nr:phosphoadenylyl-sulfate reductase [Actinomycetota bacterium]